MDGWTIGAIVAGLALIAGAIKSTDVITAKFGKLFEKALAPTNAQLNELAKKVDSANIERAKDFIVRFLADVEQDDPISVEEIKRFWENYDFYTSKGYNSYLHEKVEKLKAQGKL